MITFREFVSLPKKIRVEVPQTILNEATRITVGNYTARRDPPHYQGDEYHGHSDIPGGYEVSWGMSGARRHPNKFPANIPNDARIAVATVLGIKPELLEAYLIFDETIWEDVILLEIKNS